MYSESTNGTFNSVLFFKTYTNMSFSPLILKFEKHCSRGSKGRERKGILWREMEVLLSDLLQKCLFQETFHKQKLSMVLQELTVPIESFVCS